LGIIGKSRRVPTRVGGPCLFSVHGAGGKYTAYDLKCSEKSYLEGSVKGSAGFVILPKRLFKG